MIGNLVIWPNVYPTIYLPKLKFEYGYSHSNAILPSRLKLGRCKPHKAAKRRASSIKCDVINDVKLLQTV